MRYSLRMALSFHVHVDRQLMEVRSGHETIWAVPVSTSRFGLGETYDSYKTPRGRHHVEEKIGDGEPRGRVFKARQPQEEIWAPGNAVDCEGLEKDLDLILTRILWLAGDELENQNTHSRYVYFHGTNREDQIGQPASHGCIRLRNEDILRLFDFAEPGTQVWIA